MRPLRLQALLPLLALLSGSCLCFAVGLVNPVAPVGCSAAAGSCIRIGYYACPTPVTCSTFVGYNEMLAWYRQRTTAILGVPVYFVEAIQTGYYASPRSEYVDTMTHAFLGPDPTKPLVDYVILPGGSWELGMVLLEQARIPAIASLSPASVLYQCGPTEDAWRQQVGCQAKNSRRFQYAHSLISPGEQYLQAWVGLLKLRKAQTIGIVQLSTGSGFYQSVRAGLISTASDNHIRVVYDKRVGENSFATASRVIDELRWLPAADQPDGFAIATQDCVPWIQAMKAANYAPKSVAAILCSDGVGPMAQLGADLNYIVGPSQWSPSLSGADYTESADTQPWALFPHIKNEQPLNDTSPLQFQQLFRQLVNDSQAVPGYAEASVLLAPNILEGAMTLAGSVDPELVNAQLKVLYQPSYYGVITTNRFGLNNQKPIVINQRDSAGVLQLISPTGSATGDLIYPMPAWDERHFTSRMFYTHIELAMIILLSVCCAFTLGLMAHIFVRRSQEIFQAAGLPFYMLMGLGCVMAYLGILTWPVENNQATCATRVWLWTISFHLIVDPILASSYRIASIYSNRLQTRKITHRALGGLVVALMAPQVLINSLWSAIVPLSPQVLTADPLRPALTSFTTCTLSEGAMWLVGITLAYCCLLLLSAVYLAYKIRNAYAMFNDAQPIAASIFLFALVAAVVLVVQIALNEDNVSSQKVLFGLRSIGVLLAYQGSIGMLFLRRIFDGRRTLPLVAPPRRPDIGTSEMQWSDDTPKPPMPLYDTNASGTPNSLLALTPDSAVYGGGGTDPGGEHLESTPVALMPMRGRENLVMPLDGSMAPRHLEHGRLPGIAPPPNTFAISMDSSHTCAPVRPFAGRPGLLDARPSLQHVLDGTALLPSDSDLRSWSSLDLVPFVRALYELAVQRELLVHLTRFRLPGSPAEKSH